MPRKKLSELPTTEVLDGGELLYVVKDGADKNVKASVLQISNPPTGMCKVTNIYVNPTNGKLVVKYNDTPE